MIMMQTPGRGGGHLGLLTRVLVTPKRKREAGNAVESIAKRTCLRYAEEGKELTKEGNQTTVENEKVDVTISYTICHGARGARHLTLLVDEFSHWYEYRKGNSLRNKKPAAPPCKQTDCSQRSPKAHDYRLNLLKLINNS